MNFEVKRDDLRTTRAVEGEPVAGDSEVLLRVEVFALTSNNVTYAVFGDAMRYWAFFPASADGWGIGDRERGARRRNDGEAQDTQFEDPSEGVPP